MSVLVVYATKSGSTQEVAEAIAETLIGQGVTVEVRPCRDDPDPAAYDAVIIGSPILYGRLHRDAARFLRRHGSALAAQPVAAFLTCLELTTTPDMPSAVRQVFVDPQLDRPPAVAGHLTYFERTHLLSAFLAELLAPAPQVAPVSVAVFRGKLAYATLDPISRVGMKLIRLVYGRAPAGDHRDWTVIRYWAADLATAMQVQPKPREP